MDPSISAATVPKDKKFISKRTAVFLLKLVVTVLVMAMLIRNISIGSLISAFAQANHLYIIVALLLVVPNIYIQYYKWYFLLRLIKPDVRSKESLFSLLAGFTFGFITPGRIGEFGRAFYISNCSWIKVIGISFIDKFFALAVVIFTGAIGMLTLVGGQLHLYVLLPFAVFTIIALLFLRYLLLHPELFKGLLYHLNIMLPFRDKIKLLMSSFDNFHRAQATRLLGLSALFYFVFFCQYFLLISAFEPVFITKAFQAISSTLLAKSMLPISLGDLGIRESAAIFFMGRIGAERATAFNASILLFFINILLPSLAGLIIILRNRIVNNHERS